MRHPADCRKTLLALTLAVLACACERTPAPSRAVGIPPNAVLSIFAPSLGELRAMSAFVDPLNVEAAGDDDKPAWLACDAASVCMLRRAATTTRRQSDDIWHVPDGDGSLVVWGVQDEAELDHVLQRWRSGKAPEPRDGAWTGFIEPATLLSQWKPKNARASDLVERVTFQAGRIDFVVTFDGPQVIDAELRMKPRPGEPVFVGDLGLPATDVSDLGGLTEPRMLGVVRISADPAKLFELGRSLLGAPERGELDDLLAELESNAALDLQKELAAALDGHIAMFAYEIREPSDLRSLLTLTSTTDTIVVGVKDRQRLRELLDAWTQLSGGALQTQVSGDTPSWAWLTDGELRWTAILGEKHLLIADSDGAIERTKRWRDEPGLPLADVLEERGANALFEGRARSGLYVDVERLRRVLPDTFGTAAPIASISVTAEPSDGHETIRVRLTTSTPIR